MNNIKEYMEDKIYMKPEDSVKRLLEITKFMKTPGTAVRFERFVNGTTISNIGDAMSYIYSSSVLQEKLLGKVTIEHVRNVIDSHVVLEKVPEFDCPYMKVVKVGNSYIPIMQIKMVQVLDNNGSNEYEKKKPKQLRIAAGFDNGFVFNCGEDEARQKLDEILYKIEHYG